MTTPIFSLIGPAIRNKEYKKVYDNISLKSNVSFEMIFVGNKEPIETMPSNFKYIYTDVKPAQCLEIAARVAIGEYLIILTDDSFYSYNFLNRLYNYALRLDRDKYVMSFRCQYEDHPPKDERLVLYKGIPTSPVIGAGGCFRRDIWKKLGGIDRRYIGGRSDNDMLLRFFEYGFCLFIPPDCIVSEHRTDTVTDLWKRTGKQGTKLTNSFWLKSNNEVSKTRLLPVESFDDKDILTTNQG